VTPPDDATRNGLSESLHISEERSRLIIESLRDYAIFMLDPGGHICSWNPGAELIKGYKAREIIGQHFSKFYPQEAVVRGWPEYELEAARRDGRFEDEGWRIRKDGSRFWANVIITAVRNEAGEIAGYAKITRDLTEHRLRDEQLRLSEESLHLLIEGVRDYAIFMIDPHGIVVTWNAGAEHIKGYKAKEIIGRHFSLFYPPDDTAAGKPARLLNEALTSGRAEDEGWRIRNDGSRFWADTIITVLRDDQGQLRGYAKVTRDLTDRRRIQALEESGRRINEFLAMLAHELRNPLAPIRNAVSVMQQPGVSSQQLAWSRDVIDRQVTHLAHLVDDLLDVSRITTGKIVLRNDVIDLRDVIERAIEAVRPFIDARKHHLSTTTPGRPVQVAGDLTRLSQIVLNLLNNAAKYTHEGGRIAVALTDDDEHAAITVSDTGVGIPGDLLPKVFDLFAQGERTLDRADGGLGIGLTLVQRLVEMHGGTVRAESAGRDHGSSFTIRLPLRREQVDRTPPRPTIERSPSDSGRILVVDDNVDSAETIAMLLQISGHETLTAFDGASAIEMARKHHPDVVLLDLGLPEMSGFEVAEQLRQARGLERMVLIAMTGYGQDEDRRRTAEAGFAQHLVKPADPTTLKNAVSDALRKSRCE
jgi:PAS domain S-box-containing protein